MKDASPLSPFIKLEPIPPSTSGSQNSIEMDEILRIAAGIGWANASILNEMGDIVDQYNDIVNIYHSPRTSSLTLSFNTKRQTFLESAAKSGDVRGAEAVASAAQKALHRGHIALYELSIDTVSEYIQIMELFKTFFVAGTADCTGPVDPSTVGLTQTIISSFSAMMGCIEQYVTLCTGMLWFTDGPQPYTGRLPTVRASYKAVTQHYNALIEEGSAARLPPGSNALYTRLQDLISVHIPYKMAGNLCKLTPFGYVPRRWTPSRRNKQTNPDVYEKLYGESFYSIRDSRFQIETLLRPLWDIMNATDPAAAANFANVFQGLATLMGAAANEHAASNPQSYAADAEKALMESALGSLKQMFQLMMQLY